MFKDSKPEFLEFNVLRKCSAHHRALHVGGGIVIVSEDDQEDCLAKYYKGARIKLRKVNDEGLYEHHEDGFRGRFWWHEIEAMVGRGHWWSCPHNNT